jgi:uncharacterized iron-regulated membrane protein
VTGYRLAKDRNAAAIAHDANLPIHTGAILGLPGKILAFLVSFVSATLPITGFLMWWGKRSSARLSRAGDLSEAMTRRKGMGGITRMSL